MTAGLSVGTALVAACSSPKPGEVAKDGSITVKHIFGETKIPAPPKRVVSAGFTEQDDLLARSGLDRRQQIGRRGIHRLAAAHDLVHPQGPEDAPDPLARAYRDHGAPDRLGVRLDAKRLVVAIDQVQDDPARVGQLEGHETGLLRDCSALLLEQSRDGLR